MSVTILLLLPLLGALLTLLFKGKTVKTAALVFTLAELVLAAVMLAGFKPANASMQYLVDYTWIATYGIHFKAGIDGISMVLVLLTTVLVPLIVLSTFKHKTEYTSAFYALILFMQAGLLLVFTALDAFLFYVGWEIALIPIYFICAIWGTGDKARITLKFFIYTFAGSLFMLMGIIYLHAVTGAANTFDLQAFYNLRLNSAQQTFIFWLFFFAFAIKIPIFPLHTWQPDTYTESPTAGSMLLSGIMLKMGLYGLIRWLLPIAPQGVNEWTPVAITLAVIGIVYASIIAFKQNDGKRLLAYSSIAHVGLIAAGIFALNVQGMQGAVIQMLNHGINVIGLFFVADVLSTRLNTRQLSDMGGIAKVAPKFALGFLLVVLGSVALPLTNGFVGEFLLLNGVYQYSIWLAAFAGLTIIFGAVYMLRMYKTVMQGETNALTATFTDISGTEVLVFAIIGALIIFIGVYPQPILNISEASVTNLVNTVTQKIISAK